MQRIDDAHVNHYREHGYAIVERFLTDDELRRSHAEIEVQIPGYLDYAAGATRTRPPGWDEPARSRRTTRFPFRGEQLNRNTMHPDLVAFAALQCGHDDLFCEQGDLSYKCQGHAADNEQAMHVDYMNHTLAYPPAMPRYWQTAYLLYYTDVDEGQAPTAVCSRRHYDGELLWPASYTREERPELYDNEVRTIVPAGSLLIYSMRTFHRGTAFRRDSARVGQFITYSPAGCPWLGIVGWPEQGVYASFRAWIERSTLAERNLIGFPRPGDPYWCEETTAGVRARFPGLDMTPYLPAN